MMYETPWLMSNVLLGGVQMSVVAEKTMPRKCFTALLRRIIGYRPTVRVVTCGVVA